MACLGVFLSLGPPVAWERKAKVEISHFIRPGFADILTSKLPSSKPPIQKPSNICPCSSMISFIWGPLLLSLGMLGSWNPSPQPSPFDSFHLGSGVCSQLACWLLEAKRSADGLPFARFEPQETSTFLSRDGGLTWVEAHKAGLGGHGSKQNRPNTRLFVGYSERNLFFHGKYLFLPVKG